MGYIMIKKILILNLLFCVFQSFSMYNSQNFKRIDGLQDAENACLSNLRMIKQNRTTFLTIFPDQSHTYSKCEIGLSSLIEFIKDTKSKMGILSSGLTPMRNNQFLLDKKFESKLKNRIQELIGYECRYLEILERILYKRAQYDDLLKKRGNEKDVIKRVYRDMIDDNSDEIIIRKSLQKIRNIRDKVEAVLNRLRPAEDINSDDFIYELNYLFDFKKPESYEKQSRKLGVFDCLSQLINMLSCCRRK